MFKHTPPASWGGSEPWGRAGLEPSAHKPEGGRGQDLSVSVCAPRQPAPIGKLKLYCFMFHASSQHQPYSKQGRSCTCARRRYFAQQRLAFNPLG
jgi:hypothetical protein